MHSIQAVTLALSQHSYMPLSRQNIPRAAQSSSLMPRPLEGDCGWVEALVGIGTGAHGSSVGSTDLLSAKLPGRLHNRWSQGCAAVVVVLVLEVWS
jgi:hypothetical protein